MTNVVRRYDVQSALVAEMLNPVTHKAEKPASSTVTNACKAEIPACGSLIYLHKYEMSAWEFREKLLQIMLCLGALGLGTQCFRSSGVRGLRSLMTTLQ